MSDTDDSPYRYYLFNLCDSSIYHFGGDMYRFFRVTKGYLADGIDAAKAENLLTFYINTLSVDNPYYMLDTTTMREIVNDWRRDPDDTLRYSHEHWAADLNGSRKPRCRFR